MIEVAVSAFVITGSPALIISFVLLVLLVLGAVTFFRMAAPAFGSRAAHTPWSHDRTTVQRADAELVPRGDTTRNPRRPEDRPPRSHGQTRP